jgi:uncharacterized membrane protein
MLGLTTLGVFHTAISLVALVSGFWALIRYKEILQETRLGLVYLVTTFITAATGFGIFQHGGFGPPHVLGVLTILALLVGTIAGNSRAFGRASPYVRSISYSATLFFHMIPAVTETSTRLPLGAPLLSSPDAPALRVATVLFLVTFLVGATLQVRRMRAAAAKTNPTS